MNGAPKHVEKVAWGSVMPISVPATLAVYPDMKWYAACSGVKRDNGGRTPNASQVRKTTFFGLPAMESIVLLSIDSIEYDPRVF